MRTKIFILGLLCFCQYFLIAQDEWTIVYVKPGDNIFHLEGCKELEGFGKTGMILSQAIDKGFKPCNKCLKNFNLDKFLRAKKGTTIQENLTHQREEYLKNHPSISQEMRYAINNGNLLIGMDQEQVIASRGNPLRINKTTTQYGVNEQWIMYDTVPSWDLKAKEYKYIYFENGKLIGWQSEY